MDLPNAVAVLAMVLIVVLVPHVNDKYRNR